VFCRGLRSGYVKSPVSWSFCSSTDVLCISTPLQCKEIPASILPARVTLKHWQRCQCVFVKTAVKSSSWLGEARHSINLSGIAHSRGVDLSFVDPLNSSSSKRQSFMRWRRGSSLQPNKRSIPTPLCTYSQSMNTTVKPQQQTPSSFVKKEKKTTTKWVTTYTQDRSVPLHLLSHWTGGKKRLWICLHLFIRERKLMFWWKCQVLLMHEQCNQAVPWLSPSEFPTLATTRNCQWTRKIGMTWQLYVPILLWFFFLKTKLPNTRTTYWTVNRQVLNVLYTRTIITVISWSG